MGEIMKKFVVIIVVLMIAVSAIMSLSQSVTYGQSTTKPSAPQFTIQVISGSSLQLIIENQNFTSSSSINAIIYYYKVQDHYGDQWMIDMKRDLGRRTILLLIKNGCTRYTSIQDRVTAKCKEFASSNTAKKQFYKYLIPRGYIERIRPVKYKLTQKGEKYLDIMMLNPVE
jgi:hypothetical protein